MQLAGQVYYTNKHIETTLRRIQPERSIVISYEKFCRAPEEIYEGILSLLRLHGCNINQVYTGPTSFQASFNLHDEFIVAEAEKALSYLPTS